MRMWMIPPALLCRKHLLGCHVECHMLAGAILKGRSIAGHLERGQVEPQCLEEYHNALANEMVRRGYRHCSPLNMIATGICGYVDTQKSIDDLRTRCADCRERIDSAQK
jgi:hypothetical protein